MSPQEVFTPNRYPEHNYVKRRDRNLEEKLQFGIETPGEIVSLSGPSKSGKTVLVNRVVGEDFLIVVQGAGINSPAELWDAVLDWMDAPSSTGRSSGSDTRVGGRVNGGGQIGIPGIGEGELRGSFEGDYTTREDTSEQRGRRGLRQVVEDISESDFVLLIDDFHYIKRGVQADIAEAIKEAAREEISICVALVPHRSDDLVRANDDLRGRVRGLQIDYWDTHDLKQIAYKGFDVLDVDFSEHAIERFAKEAAGSPQLMQLLCLQSCLEMSITGETDGGKVELRKGEIEEIFRKSAEYADHASTFEVLDSGPKPRGTERKIYDFIDGNSGDVYRCLLRAIAADPPKLSFHYDELKNRTELQCAGEEPRGSSITGSCSQMETEVRDSFPDQRAIEWDDTKQFLDIPDPYLLFYLRWSGRLGNRP